MDEDSELDRDFAKDERIFHYTSAQGLYGILESKCFWATHFQFLNDSKEFYVARDSLIEFVRKEIHKQLAAWKVNKQAEFKDGITLADLAEHEANVIVDALYKTSYDKVGAPFVFSGFCYKPDHKHYQNGGLLHWATYGQKGGYAIRLNPHRLASLLKKESTQFGDFGYRSGKVVYSSEAPESRFSKEYQIIGKVARSMVEGIAKNKLTDVDVSESADPFWNVSSMLKDDYFSDESEARIVAMLVNLDKPDIRRHTIHMRHGDGVSIPYIKIFEQILIGENCPIDAIIVGPHPEKERRLRALSTYIRHVGLKFIEIIESNVPYVG